MLAGRQSRAYTDTFDLYEPTVASVGPTLEVRDLSYPPTPTYSSVAGHLEATPNVNVPTAAGSTKETNIFTDDRLHLPSTQVCGSMWLAILRTPGHPLENQCWVVQGQAEVKAWRAGKTMYYAVMTPTPPEIS